ncbi:MAG: hypothetical protein AAF989_07695 [Planctomycetota bacterium]
MPRKSRTRNRKRAAARPKDQKSARPQSTPPRSPEPTNNTDLHSATTELSGSQDAAADIPPSVEPQTDTVGHIENSPEVGPVPNPAASDPVETVPVDSQETNSALEVRGTDEQRPETSAADNAAQNESSPNNVEQESAVLNQQVAATLLSEFKELKRLVVQATQLEELAGRCEELTQENSLLLSNQEELLQQIEHLSRHSDCSEGEPSKNANPPTHSIVGESAGDLLSWEERKELIFKQMEDDSFDAESFLHSMNQSAGDSATCLGSLADENETESDEAYPPNALPANPFEAVEQLFTLVDQLQGDLNRRDEEIGELRCLLETREEPAEGIAGEGLAVGASAIAQIFDGDELILEERNRLQTMQQEWDEKFRQAEIEASLERAKLSRERQELARKAEELDEQLEQAKQALENSRQPDGKKRRWLAELGLGSE